MARKKLDENENAFLITEAVRGYGGELWTHFEDGERFMPKYDERNELAPRDVVYDIHAEIQKQLAVLYLDITKKDADDIAKNFPGIYKELKTKLRYDETENSSETSGPLPLRRCQDEH